MTGQRPRNRLRRGQPLIALGLLLTAWVGARAMLYEDTVPVPALVEVEVKVPTMAAPAIRSAAPARPVPVVPTVTRPSSTPPRPFVAAPAAAPDFERVRIAEGHQLLWQAAIAPPPDPAITPEPNPPAAPATE